MFMERVLMLYSSHKNENENFARNRLLTAKSKDAHIVMFFAELYCLNGRKGTAASQKHRRCFDQMN